MEHQENKIKWFSIATIWFGGMVCVPALLVGSTVIQGQSFSSALIASLLGFSFVVLYMVLLSIAAFQKNKATVPLAESSFGRYGANIIVGLVIGISILGWFAIQSNIAGASFSKIILDAFGLDIPAWISSVFWGIIMVLTAVFGLKYLKWLNYIAVPSIIFLVVYAMIITFQNHSFQEILEYTPEAKAGLSFIGVIGFAMGFISVGGVISPDYNRFAESKKDLILGSILGVIPSALALVAVGGVLAITQGTYDIVEIFSSLGYPFLAMTILILATWTTNVMNIFSAGLAFNKVFQQGEEKRSKTTLIIGVVAIVLASVGLINHFQAFIGLLTVFVPPIAGVVIADYFVAKSYAENSKNFNWKGIFSWVVGAILIYFINHDLKYVFGIVGAALLFVIIEKLSPTTQKN